MHYGMNTFPPYSEYRSAKEASLTVQGTGTVRAKPDVVVLTIGVVTENTNVQKAQEENAIASNKLLSVLQALTVSDQNIETLSYTISPEYDYKDGISTLRGYRVEHLYEITVLNVQKAGEVYNRAVEAGANITRNLKFRVSNPETYNEEALTRAVRHAQTKAKTIATTLGISVNLIPISVTEQPSPMPREHIAFAAESAKSAPPIQPGELDVTVTIEAVFTYIS